VSARDQIEVRPFEPGRDAQSVVRLIELAFGDKLGPDGDVVVAEMRRVARWGPLLQWIYWPIWGGGEFAPGFVWVEGGRVCGNVSIRRALEWGGFFIGNVAVHPEKRGRGIASALMERAIEAIREQRGQWVGLEVRADNQVAQKLYEQLGFREVGRTRHMLRPANVDKEVPLSSQPPLRRGCSQDSAALISLVRTLIPAPHRPLLELRTEEYRPKWSYPMSLWFNGRYQVWWVVEEGGEIRGAVRAVRVWGRRPHRLEILIAPECEGCFEMALVQRGIDSVQGISKKMIEIELPSFTNSLVGALKEHGFEALRTLVQMRLDLGRRIPVREY